MENGLNFSPAAGFAVPQFYEYMLVIQPAKEVHETITGEKERFSAYYKTSAARKTLPYITVAGFLAKEGMEDTIIKWMRRTLSSQQSFNVMLNNYSGLPAHTIYARVQDHEPFKQLAASLKIIDQYIRDNGCPPARLNSRPHIAIAEKLQPCIYEKAMFDYARKTFHALFTADELILLKRQNQFDKYRQVNVFKMTSPSFALQREGN